MEWRRPTQTEESFLRMLLANEFQGRDELMRQFGTAAVRVIDDEGSLEIRVVGEGRAPVSRRIPVEAQTSDRGGVTIHALLHVVDGQIKELEFYKDDSSAITHQPPPGQWEVFTP